MDYVRRYRNFTSSHHFTDAVRTATGILIPAFVFGYFDEMQLGIAMSLGAMFVSGTDSPGPVHHRRNGMLATIVAIFITSFVTNSVNESEVLTGALIIVSGFIFSMLGVLGARPGAVGLSALIVLTLSIDNTIQPPLPALQQSLLIAAGGVWYACFSLLVYSFQPYRLSQQALGEWIQTIASYVRTRATLYAADVNYTDTYNTLLQLQAEVQDKQKVLRDLLLKTRAIVKESTQTGRLLLITFIEMSDLFEKLITSYIRYSDLHKHFGPTGLLDELHNLICGIAAELEEVGLAIKSRRLPQVKHDLDVQLAQIRSRFEKIESENVGEENTDVFISMRRIMHNAEDIINEIEDTRYNLEHGISRQKLKQNPLRDTVGQFAESQPVDLGLFRDNLTLKSDVFRHSLRLTIALFTGFIAAIIFNIGHGYWILLTLLVIMKPAYSLSKKRNQDRLLGTVIGVLIGLTILQVTTNHAVLLIIIVLLMIASYTFIRTNYLVSVVLMTPYVLIFFYFLQPKLFGELLKDRVIDTIIGSVIAFGASFLFPTWEKQKMRQLMIDAMENIRDYFAAIASGLEARAHGTTQRLARKYAFIALANVSDAFNRMLNEPKYKQQNASEVQQFVVLLHSLVSYIATLSYLIHNKKTFAATELLVKASDGIQEKMNNVVTRLQLSKLSTASVNEALIQLNEYTNQLQEQQKQEIEQGWTDRPSQSALFETKSVAHQFNLINRATVDLYKMTKKLQHLD